MSIQTANIEDGLRQLEELAHGEFGVSLSSVLGNTDQNLAFRQIGRLMAVWPKTTFAKTFPYDPEIPTNWAKSTRCWEIHNTPSAESIAQNQTKAQLLVLFAAEWDRPVETLFEFNIFLSMCKVLKPVICNENKPIKNAKAISKLLQKEGHDVSLLTTDKVIAIAALSASNYFIESVSWLSDEHIPIVLGCTLLTLCYSQNALCQLITEFIGSDDPKKDRLANVTFPQCKSNNTTNGKPCKNKVVRDGVACWIHAKDKI